MNGSEKAIEMLCEQKKSNAGVFFIELTKLLIGQKCNKCFWAAFVSVSQEDGEKLTSIFKIKDGVKQHGMGRSGEGWSGASPVNPGALGELQQTIPKEKAAG